VTSQTSITRYFASAAETWGGMTVLADALRRNPSAPVTVLRIQSGLNRATVIPLGVMGDESKRTVLSLPIGPDNYETHGRSEPRRLGAWKGVLRRPRRSLTQVWSGSVKSSLGTRPIVDELSDVAGAGLRLAGGASAGRAGAPHTDGRQHRKRES
jgi:hypothetical protein